MYDSIFINSNGSGLYTTLGTLTKVDNEISNIKYWNVCGNASLVLFFKILGFTYQQIYEKLKLFNLVNSFISGHSLFPENQEEKKQFIKEYLTENLIDTGFFKKDITLGKIKNLTGLIPCFIVWSRTQQKIINLHHEDLKLVDCVMATLCNVGVYDTYTIKGQIYSSLENIECMPVAYSMLEKIQNLFCLINIITYDKKFSLNINLGPLRTIEDELLMQKGELNNYRIEKTCKALSNYNICKIYSFYSRGDTKEEEKRSLFVLGFKQGEGYLNKQNTQDVYQEYLKTIYSQS